MFAVQADVRLALENFLCLAMGGLHDKIIERRACEIGGSLAGFPRARRNACDKAGLLFGYG